VVASARRHRPAAVVAIAAVAITLTAAASACSGPPAHGARPPGHLIRKAVGSHTPAASRIGVLGGYPVGTRYTTFTEPAHVAPTGTHLGPRSLLTEIRYPLARRPSPTASPAGPGRDPAAKGPFPLIVFAPGFMQCGGSYSAMLRGWASAGYVVVTVDFPHSDCKVGNRATEADMVNQPGDVSYLITKLLQLDAAPHGLLSGLLRRGQIAITGQSDGGDTVAAIAANTCCADHRVRAVAVLSGAEWAPMPGHYFTRRPVPMLFTQGSRDVVNPPVLSRQMYLADKAQDRFYLDLFGASHTRPYWGRNPVEQIVVKVTLAFFNRFVLGQTSQGPVIKRAGNVPGVAVLVSGRQPPP
jgi:dienelactone hydrolase